GSRTIHANAGTLVFGGSIGGTAGLLIQGGGLVSFVAPTTYTQSSSVNANTRVQAGTLQIGTGGSLNIATNGVSGANATQTAALSLGAAGPPATFGVLMLG